MTDIFAAVARSYYQLGLAPIPLGRPDWANRHAKAAFVQGWQSFARKLYDSATLEEWLTRFREHNVGIGLGTVIEPGWQLVAIDIDNDEVWPRIEMAIGKSKLVCGKRGAKGVTWFVLVPEDIKTKALRYRKDPKSKPEGTAVDFLAYERQTVIPPSVHPDTKKPYEWIGVPLDKIGLTNLPRLSRGAVLEIEAVCAGADRYFNGGAIEDGTVIPGINNMAWKGVGGGGDTYDSRLRAVAHMVATGWTDDDIVERIDRAQREAVERSGEKYEWTDCAQETRRFIEDARKKGFGEPKEKPKKKPVERVMGEWLIAMHDHLVANSGTFYAYVDGHYAPISDESMVSMVVNQFETSTAAIAGAAAATAKAKVLNEKFGAKARDKICLLNGTLEVLSGDLRPWAAEDEILHQLPIAWNPATECPLYDNFIRQVFDEDAQAVACFDEFAGLTLVDDMSLQKAMFLLGPGGNGKSTLISLLMAAHSPDAVSNISITKLNDERMVTSLVGKLLNVSTEQSRLDSISDTTFKSIIGGDPISVRKLYAEVENNVRLKVRFLCAANELPSTNDSSEAMRRRLIILSCPRVVPDNQRDPLLLDKLKTELPGVLRRWVNALHRLRDRGRFDEPDSSKAMVDRYILENDPVKVWVAQRINFREEGPTPIDELYADYVEWAKLNGYLRPLQSVLWFRRVEASDSLKDRVTTVEFPDGRTLRAIRVRLNPTVISSHIANRI